MVKCEALSDRPNVELGLAFMLVSGTSHLFSCGQRGTGVVEWASAWYERYATVAVAATSATRTVTLTSERPLPELGDASIVDVVDFPDVRRARAHHDDDDEVSGRKVDPVCGSMEESPADAEVAPVPAAGEAEMDKSAARASGEDSNSTRDNGESPGGFGANISDE